MPRLSSKALIFRNPDAAWRFLDKTLVAVTPHDTAIHRFNGSASFLWETIGEKGIPIEKLHQTLLDRYETTPAKAEKDLNAFLSKAMKHRLVYAKS